MYLARGQVARRAVRGHRESVVKASIELNRGFSGMVERRQHWGRCRDWRCLGIFALYMQLVVHIKFEPSLPFQMSLS